MIGMRITPLLMFQGDAEAAMGFYVSLFPGAAIVAVSRYGPGEAGAEGAVKQARFRLAGQMLCCIDSAVQHDFSFTPAFSLFVECDSAAEFERISHALAEAGKILMPAADYGFSRSFAWITDRFGVSWQVNLP
jgi:predicted 3-demethylubiquinone-9 3-methyltransferase (glyoxalase superfamily)